MKVRLLIVLILVFGLVHMVNAKGSLSEIDPITNVEDQNIKTMSIHKTGFFSKKVTIITYNADDYSIISVEVNGKMLPEKDFKKYQKIVMEGREFKAFTALEPEYNEVLQSIEDEKMSNIEKLAAIDDLTLKLEKEKVSESSIMASHLDILRSSFSSELLREKILAIMQESDSTKIDKVMTAEFKKGQCKVNKIKLSEELSARLYKLLEEYKGAEIGKDESVVFYF